MLDRRQSGPALPGSFLARSRPAGWQSLHRAHSRLPLKDLYSRDHAESRQGGGFRWLVSTCLAATVGAVAIFVVIYGSADPIEGSEGLLPSLKRMGEDAVTPVMIEIKHRQEGLRWAVPRTDRLQVMTGAMSTRFTIHETTRQRRAGREYIYAKPYVRVVSRLAPVPANYADVIPPFNPFKLFANSKPVGSSDEDGGTGDARTDVAIKVVELLGGILPEEDGQELETKEVEDLVDKSDGSDADGANAGQATAGDLSALAESAGQLGAYAGTGGSQSTTILRKSSFDADDADEADDGGKKVMTVKVGAGDTLTKILTTAGAEKWQAKTMIESAATAFPEASLAAGQEVQITLVPSLTQQDRMEPVRFSVYATMEGNKEHKVTVSRNAAGEFVASTEEAKAGEELRAAMGEGDQPQSSSLYSSIYYTSLVQHVPPETIMQILKIHAYDTDFRRRIRAGDQVELFFDPKDETASDAPPGELLCTSVTAGAETHKFYRFRTNDGVVDFYDAQGNNSKKFLMRRPVRSADVRLTSGFGMRRHPLLGEYKMHTGIDWSAPIGTPILASGNGTIEEAGRKGYNGNYIRIRHANGYQTAYSHMSRFGDGVEAGVKVRQGQVIGYVGSTGLSSGPHLHFEVLVNTRFVDPMSIQVPQERQLATKELTDFQKERTRIDDLMRRAPVKTETTASR